MTDFYPTISASIPQTSPTTPLQLTQEIRKQQVISLILQRMNPGKIAEKLGVDRKTVYNDFMEWAKSEQASYLQVEWMQPYEVMKQEDPQTAFDALTKLMMKLLEKQAKVEFNLTQNNQTNIQVDISNEVNELIKISREENCKPKEPLPS